MSLATFIQASAHSLPMMADGSVQMIATSPPYYGLRAYSGDQGVEWPAVTYRLNEWVEPTTVAPMTCGLGTESSPVAYIGHLILCLREWRRVLRDDGTCWVNLGDSYNGSGGPPTTTNFGKPFDGKTGSFTAQARNLGELKPKDLCMIPALFAIAARADGWWLRSDIVWCLSGGTLVYTKTQKGVMPMTIKDMARLRPDTVQLWNGEKWTQLLGISKSPRKGDEVELVLRSGERIACTPSHRFPTDRGILEAGEIRVGDTLRRTRLAPDENSREARHIDDDAAWLAGLYLAEGSKAGDTIQIAGHASQVERWARVRRIAADYGGSATVTIDGNNQSIRIYGKVLNAIIATLVNGRTAKDKGFAPVVWQYSDGFIRSMMEGYLSGDGHWEEFNRRWRLGFTRNYNLERDLRTACARLGWHLVLNLSTTTIDSKAYPTFRGEIRTLRSGHHNERNTAEVVEIRKARCREVYDLGVADEPHLFALASGVMTHNSKPNPMPESVTDRPTKAHEYIFLLAKSARYYWDAEAVKEGSVSDHPSGNGYKRDARLSYRDENGARGNDEQWQVQPTRNIRSVWHVATSPFGGAHFATWPEKLVEPMVKAGSSERGCCPTCGAPWQRVTERSGEWRAQHERKAKHNGEVYRTNPGGGIAGANTTRQTIDMGFRPSCACPEHEPTPCVVLDPFSGSGTTAKVSVRLGRKAIAVDVSSEYLDGVTAERFGDGVQMEMTL